MIRNLVVMQNTATGISKTTLKELKVEEKLGVPTLKAS